ncbi:YheC/YheD family protein [Cellulosilyticum sp. ST5]|uniref:YheC/YheD family endospore coat-associated protein n=1 Tax=Cellulosilyticum sp. ST5 TaxID=3055805 RepID=UPI0039776022
MILIGFLHQRKNPEAVKKAFAYVAVAKAEGAILLYFSPKCVDFVNEKINGYIYEDGTWLQTESRFPDVIYNTGCPEKLNHSKEVINKLKEKIPFTSYSVGRKKKVYERLKNEKEFSDYLIPQENMESTEIFLEFLEFYERIVFKPVNGRKGQEIMFIETKGNEYHVIENKESSIYELDELCQIISTKIHEKAYIAQPYINCRTKDNVVYDIRLHVQKNYNDQWHITSIYPRFAPHGTIVTNINSNGSTNYLLPFLEQEFPDSYYDIKCYLEHFALQLAEHLDSIQEKYFGESLDELGIDVALDDRQKIWIYEVNWLPGCPPTFYLELDVVKNLIHYAIFLAKRGKL